MKTPYFLLFAFFLVFLVARCGSSGSAASIPTLDLKCGSTACVK